MTINRAQVATVTGWMLIRRTLALLLLADALATIVGKRRYLASLRRLAPNWSRPAFDVVLRLPEHTIQLAAGLEALIGAWLWQEIGAGGQMRAASVSAYIAAPPEVVFAAIGDPRKLFLSANPFTRMAVVGEKTHGVGTVYRWSFTLPLGLRFQFDEVVTEWAENERFAYRALSGWQMEATTWLTPEAGGTRAHFRIRFRVSGIWRWLIPAWVVRGGSLFALASLRRRIMTPGSIQPRETSDARHSGRAFSSAHRP